MFLRRNFEFLESLRLALKKLYNKEKYFIVIPVIAAPRPPHTLLPGFQLFKGTVLEVIVGTDHRPPPGYTT